MSWAWRPELAPPKFRASYLPVARAASAARRHRSVTSSCARPVSLPVLASADLSHPSSRPCASSNLSVAHRGRTLYPIGTPTFHLLDVQLALNARERRVTFGR